LNFLPGNSSSHGVLHPKGGKNPRRAFAGETRNEVRGELSQSLRQKINRQLHLSKATIHPRRTMPKHPVNYFDGEI